jgi:dihydroflavonol-4-reductase
MPKVFVTGGNGFIGSRVVRALVDKGYAVRCLLRETSDTKRIEGVEFERHIGDIRDAKSIAAGMQGTDGCIHLASVSAWSDIRSPKLEPTVLDGTKNVLDAALSAGKLRTVFVSSAAAINASSEPRIFDESSPFELTDTPLRYAIVKHRAEEMALAMVKKDGLPVVIVNPGEVYGPDDTGFITAGNIRDILNDWPALACTGGVAITHVDDVAQGVIAAYEKGRPGERYILGGDNVTVEELVRLTLELAGQKKPVLKLPNRPLVWSIQKLAKLGVPTPVSPDVLDYATRFFFMDSSKAKKELGYSPRTAKEALAPVVEWLDRAGHLKKKRATA